jgi:hypothetical protein
MSADNITVETYTPTSVAAQTAQYQSRRIYGMIDHVGKLIKTFKGCFPLIKEQGQTYRGDGWYNTAPCLFRIQKEGIDVQQFMNQKFVATLKLDGSQCGVVSDGNNVVSGWSRNRELTENEYKGNQKFGSIGSMGTAFENFGAYVCMVSKDFKNQNPDINTVTVSAEAYRAKSGTKVAKCASIHPFQVILQMKDGQEIALLMTPQLHQFLWGRGNVDPTNIKDHRDMHNFLLCERPPLTDNRIFPAPIFHIGTLHECIQKGYQLALEAKEHYVEGIMLTLVDSPNFVMKLKTPQQMMGEFSSIKRLANSQDEVTETNIWFVDSQVRQSYALLVDLYDKFLALNKNERVDGVRSSMSKDERQRVISALASAVQVASQKILTSPLTFPPPTQFDASQPKFFTSPLEKKDFFPFLGRIQQDIFKEVAKNHQESTGQSLAKDTGKLLSDLCKTHLLSTLEPPVDTPKE